MKRTIRILGVAAVLVACAVAAAPSANAGCAVPKIFSSWGDGGYFYLVPPPGATDSSLLGRFWTIGNRASVNEGTYADTNWVKFYAPTNVWYINGTLDSPQITGCPTGSMLVLIQNNDGPTASFVAANQIETPAAQKFYDYSTLATHFTMVPIPRPQVVSSARVGSSVQMNVNIPSAQSGVYGPNTASLLQYRIVTRSGTSDSGRAAAAYTPGAVVPANTTTPLSVDCSAVTSDQWVATQLLVDGFPTDLVSAPTRVNCNPALAEPKFKLIDRKPGDVPKRERK
jgi:hypothetical protein